MRRKATKYCCALTVQKQRVKRRRRQKRTREPPRLVAKPTPTQKMVFASPCQMATSSVWSMMQMESPFSVSCTVQHRLQESPTCLAKLNLSMSGSTTRLWPEHRRDKRMTSVVSLPCLLSSCSANLGGDCSRIIACLSLPCLFSCPSQLIVGGCSRIIACLSLPCLFSCPSQLIVLLYLLDEDLGIDSGSSI